MLTKSVHYVSCAISNRFAVKIFILNMKIFIFFLISDARSADLKQTTTLKLLLLARDTLGSDLANIAQWH